MPQPQRAILQSDLELLQDAHCPECKNQRVRTHHESVPGCQASQTPGDDSPARRPAPDLASSPLPQDAAGWEKDHSAALQTPQEQPRRVINTRNHRPLPWKTPSPQDPGNL